MKRIIIFLSFFILINFNIFAKEKFISFSAGISSGFPLYGTNSVISTGNELNNTNRIILGTLASININPIPQVSFFIGNDNLWDNTWNNYEHSSKLHICFPFGIKVYPGIGGFNLGLAYALGFRYDNILTNTLGYYNNTSPWGNGFKIQLEYNFAHESQINTLPSIGAHWYLMPRGNNSYDNLITLYIAANF